MPKVGQPITSRVEALKRQAAGRWPELLSELGGVPSDVLDGRNHPCPKCGGTDRFRLIDVAAGALYCNQCFKQDNGDGIAALRWLTGWTFPEAVNALAEYMDAANSKPATTNVKPRIVATYDYRDEKGKLLYQVVRYDPKDFRQRRPKADGGWDWSVKGTRLVPYRLPELLAAPAGGTVVIVEGEKDVDRLAKLGIVATTNSGGAGKWRPEYAEQVRGRVVGVLPDNDSPGHKHAQQVAASAYGIARSVKIVILPGLPEKGDVSDWLDQGHSEAELLKLVAATPEWTPVSANVQTEPSESSDYVPFPTNVLPAVMANFIREGAAALGCDPSYISLPLLAVLAGAVGNTRRIELKPGWCEPAIVWALLVGNSGALKSPALDEVLKPLQQLETVSFAEHRKQMAAYIRDVQLYRKGKLKAEPVEPVLVRYIVKDTTLEALGPLLEKQPRGLLVAHDELSGWFASFDAYRGGRGGDAGHWLSMHGGRALTVDRIGRPTIHMPRAAVSIVGGIQPGALQRSLEGRRYFENGMAARFLLTMPPPRPKRWTEATVAPGTRAAMERVLHKLLALQFDPHKSENSPLDVPLSPEGKRAWVTFVEQHGREQADLPNDLVSVWAKTEGYAARFALLDHLVRQVSGEPALTEVEERSINAGVTLARWCADEAARVYAEIGGDAETPEAREQRKLLRIIRDHGGEITARGLMQASRRYRASAEEAEAVLQGMVTAGTGHWRNIPPTNRGGRPTRIFILGNGGNGNGTPQKPGNGEVPLPLPPDKTKPAGLAGLAAKLREAGIGIRGKNRY